VVTGKVLLPRVVVLVGEVLRVLRVGNVLLVLLPTCLMLW
jgi:hypothetical protein